MPYVKGGKTVTRLSRIKPHCRFMQFKVHPVGHSKAVLLRKKPILVSKRCTKVISWQPWWQADSSTRPPLAPAQVWSMLTIMTEKNPQVWQGPWQHLQVCCSFAITVGFPFSKLASHQFPGRKTNHCVYDALRERSEASRSLGKGKNQLSNLNFHGERRNHLPLILVGTVLLYIEKFHLYWVTPRMLHLWIAEDILYLTLFFIALVFHKCLWNKISHNWFQPSSYLLLSWFFWVWGKQCKTFCCLDIIFLSEQEPNLAVWTLYWESINMNSLQQ